MTIGRILVSAVDALLNGTGVAPLGMPMESLVATGVDPPPMFSPLSPSDGLTDSREGRPVREDERARDGATREAESMGLS